MINTICKMSLLSIASLPLIFLLVCIGFPYSTVHPYYDSLQMQINQLSDDNGLDLSEINDGNWKTACIFGGYTDPSYAMANYGRIGWFDFFYQPMKAWPIIRLAQVEEHEALVAYVDENSHVDFIHLESGATKTERSLEHVLKCTERNNPVIKDFWS